MSSKSSYLSKYLGKPASSDFQSTKKKKKKKVKAKKTMPDSVFGAPKEVFSIGFGGEHVEGSGNRPVVEDVGNAVPSVSEQQVALQGAVLRQQQDEIVAPTTRQRHDSDSDQDAIPRRRHDSDSDQDTVQRAPQRHDSDLEVERAPPSTRQCHDSDSDQDDVPRSRIRHDSDSDIEVERAPPARQRHDSDSDQDEIPRSRTRHDSDLDLEVQRAPPPARQHHDSASDIDVQRAPTRTRHDSDSDLEVERRPTSPQKRKRSSPLPEQQKRSPSPSTTPSGLKSVAELDEHMLRQRQQLTQEMQQLSEDISGRNAETVFRDRATGKRISKEEYLEMKQSQHEKRKKEREQQKQTLEQMFWGGGLAQLMNLTSLYQQKEHLTSEERGAALSFEDPMANYGKKKSKKRKREDGQGDGSATSQHPLSSAFKVPFYQGTYPTNRFEIRPGYRWDGVDRSNGFEQRYFAMLAEAENEERSAYKFRSADM